MVGRDGIEPPTPGFSDRPAAARKYAEVLYVGDLARRCSLVSIGSRWSITGTRGHRTATPQRILSASRYSALTWRTPRLCGWQRPGIAAVPVLARPGAG